MQQQCSTKLVSSGISSSCIKSSSKTARGFATLSLLRQAPHFATLTCTLLLELASGTTCTALYLMRDSRDFARKQSLEIAFNADFECAHCHDSGALHGCKSSVPDTLLAIIGCYSTLELLHQLAFKFMQPPCSADHQLSNSSR